MSSKWLITDEEDDRLQGISCEAQVMYMRGFRRYADYSTGVVNVTHGMLKRLVEFIPDDGCRNDQRRVVDITTNYVRARIAELERAGLIEKIAKKSRFETPSFCCLLAAIGSVRPDLEQQRNNKEGTTSVKPVFTLVKAEGTTKEQQGGNNKIPGIQVLQEEDKSSLSEAPASDRVSACPHLQIIDIYHDALPELPCIVVSRWTGSKDAKALQARWREDSRHQSLDFWTRFFAVVRTNSFWMGQNDRGWSANLRWLVKRDNFDKVLERMVNTQESANG
jgi:hypothetical protein